MTAIGSVDLQTWANHWGVPYRTALDWAKKGKIAATKEKRKIEVKRTVTVNGYIINPLTDPHILGLL